jgi:hypothetical protein
MQRLLFAAVVSGALLFLSGGVEAAWRSAKASPARSGYELEALNANRDTETSRRYYRLDPGDTLVVPVSGSGPVRIKTRAVVANGTNPSHFRYAIALGERETRRFKRRNGDAQPFRVQSKDGSGHQEYLQLGSLNSLEIDAPAGTNEIRLWMNPREDQSAFVRMLLGGEVAQPERQVVESPAVRGLLQVGAGGYDSNAYLSPVSADSVSGLTYWPLGARLQYRSSKSRPWRLAAAYNFDGRFYTHSILNESVHAVRFTARRRISVDRSLVELEARLRSRNTTFVGRGDEEEFETTDDNGETVSLADRFDYRDVRVRARTRLRMAKSVSGKVHASLQRKDYRKDFEGSPDIYSLDQIRLETGVRIEWALDRRWSIEVGADLKKKNYDEKFSRDLDGAEVRTVPASYENRIVLGAVQFRQGGVAAGAQVRLGKTIDRYAGYWDASTWKVSGDVGYRWKRGHGVEIGLSRSHSDYDAARLGYDPSGDLRVKGSTRLRLSGTYRMYASVDLFGEYRFEHVDNNSETFAYERSVLETGLAMRF